MTSPVKVLVYGALDAGSCDVFRCGMYRDHLAALGVTLRPWTELHVDFAPGWENRPLEAVEAGAFEIDRTDLDWADVIVFRRYYFTTAACLVCAVALGSIAGFLPAWRAARVAPMTAIRLGGGLRA